MGFFIAKTLQLFKESRLPACLTYCFVSILMSQTSLPIIHYFILLLSII